MRVDVVALITKVFLSVSLSLYISCCLRQIGYRIDTGDQGAVGGDQVNGQPTYEV